MANKPDERLIILLPPDLLEQVRRAAEAEDLSVSQIVRRAIRNELKVIANTGVPAPDVTLTVKTLTELFREAEKNRYLTGNTVPGEVSRPSGDDPIPKIAEILRNTPREDDPIPKIADILRNKPRGRK